MDMVKSNQFIYQPAQVTK